ncbi:MAG: response regulator [Bythopirellula sp.]
MPGTRRQILLIEEDPTLADITSFRLELLGYEVAVLHSAEDARNWLADQLPDLVIVGHFLPAMDGMELLNVLSNDVRTSEIPAMLLSPESDLDDVQKAFNAGAEDYLVTPFDPQMLEQKVDKLVGRYEDLS